MVNYNGTLVEENNHFLTKDNRGYKYGDGVFETLKISDGVIQFAEDHYFRLMASMRILRMEIPKDFTLEFFESEILKCAQANNLSNQIRCRLTVTRKDGGLYNPKTNDIDFLIETSDLNLKENSSYVVDLYKDFYVYSGMLSTIKTTNKAINVVASIFAFENDYDTCLLVNEKKNLVEATHGNVFLIFGNKVITPSITEGCIKGIVRKKIIEALNKSDNFEVEEREISPFELQKADELFITNSIVDIQPVSNYRKKVYKFDKTEEIKALFKTL